MSYFGHLAPENQRPQKIFANPLPTTATDRLMFDSWLGFLILSLGRPWSISTKLIKAEVLGNSQTIQISNHWLLKFGSWSIEQAEGFSLQANGSLTKLSTAIHSPSSEISCPGIREFEFLTNFSFTTFSQISTFNFILFESNAGSTGSCWTTLMISISARMRIDLLPLHIFSIGNSIFWLSAWDFCQILSNFFKIFYFSLILCYPMESSDWEKSFKRTFAGRVSSVSSPQLPDWDQKWYFL